jgi:nitroreductase
MTRSLTSLASQYAWAADIARGAPSIFNTQPWHWRVRDNELELWADPTRQLDAVDPDGRLLTISCGVALHHVRTALTAGGDEVRTARLPDPAQPDLLARIHAVPGTPRRDDSPEQTRFGAIRVRHSDRRPFTDKPVDDAVLARLRAAAEVEGAHLHVIGAEDIPALAAAATRAAELETADPAYRAELEQWTNRPRWTGDGVRPDPSLEPAGRRVRLRDFRLDATSAAGQPDADRAATYAILWGDDDERMSWLRAGEALSAVMLDATAAGLAMSPMSDLVEVPETREVVLQLIADAGEPYLALRLGHPQGGLPDRTPRRRADDVISGTH